MHHHARLIAAALIGAALATGAGLPKAYAQDTTYLSRDAGYCEIFRSISKTVPGRCAQDGDFMAESVQPDGTLTRSIVRRDSKQPRADSAVVQRDPPKDLSIALKVKFELNSAELTPEAVHTLDRVAEVLGDELMTETFIRIEGHADASGPADYNDALSTRRAVAVRDFLIGRHGIDSMRLLSQGKGERELYDPSRPYDGVNRRVEFVNISG